MYKSILAATDGSEVADAAVSQAGQLAKALGAKLTILTVTDQPPAFSAAEVGWSVPQSVYDDLRKASREHSRAVCSKSPWRSPAPPPPP